MKGAEWPLIGTAASSSAVVRFARRVTAGSMLWSIVADAARWLRLASARAAVGLGASRSDAEESLSRERLDKLGEDSRVVAALWTFVTLPSVAWRDSKVRRSADPFTHLPLSSKVRLAGVVVGVAVLTHIVVLALLGVPVQTIGWGIRIALVVVSVGVMRRPEPMAAAWRERKARALLRHRS